MDPNVCRAVHDDRPLLWVEVPLVLRDASATGSEHRTLAATEAKSLPGGVLICKPTTVQGEMRQRIDAAVQVRVRTPFGQLSPAWRRTICRREACAES